MRKVLLLGLALTGVVVSAQPASRRSANIAALLAYPGFYHLRPVLVVGKLAVSPTGEWQLSDESATLRVLTRGNASEGVDEVRGEFWDIGRMNPTDPRLAAYDLKATFHIDPDGPWPRAGQVLALIASAVESASPPPAPSIRAMVLYPSRYLDQKITVTGQFAGRNLLGDLPDAPGRSRYDFVLRYADAAIWVTGLRPRGKDFELSLDTRIDTGRWVEVSGTVQQGRGLQWIDAQGGTLKLAKPPSETPPEAPVSVPPGPPPEVVFSAPTDDESDVSLTTSIRIQFTRDLDPTTIKGHVKVGYLESESAARGEGVKPPVEFTTQYNAGNRVLEIRLTNPLERFRTVKVELLDGITGTDKQALKPWTLTFMTGG
jgi:Bacterial Ig-like domain